MFQDMAFLTIYALYRFSLMEEERHNTIHDLNDDYLIAVLIDECPSKEAFKEMVSQLDQHEPDMSPLESLLLSVQPFSRMGQTVMMTGTPPPPRWVRTRIQALMN